MMLSLDVEFLLGVCFAAHSPSERKPDWPPQPDRLFSALVATWASRGEDETEKAALQWLERQSPPVIAASDADSRSAPTVFVPPNDMSGGLPGALPGLRSRKDRLFPAAIPHNAVATYSWKEADPEPPVAEALQALARDTAYVGHSSSLVRCNFRSDATPSENRRQIPSSLCVYPGRLEELQARFGLGKRPLPGQPTRPVEASVAQRSAGIFGSDWYVFASAGGHCPDIRRAAVATRAFRTAIMSGFQGKPIPEVISGHTATGAPSPNPHMAIFPLANVGWKFSDGRLMGLALSLPEGASKSDETALVRALAVIIRERGNPERFEVNIDLPGGDSWRLARQVAPDSASLQPHRYMRPSNVWATVTPIALDRHPKADTADGLQGEVSELVASACVRVGLPKPRIVVADKHSAIRGSVPARPSARSPEWTRWSLPASLKGRVLTHATLEFETAVRGPVCLGAGRFFGLGLCLPLDEMASQ